ncbi:MAG TPA: Cu(I)-responsive transcriptional regulator [Rhodobacteraceae bacterium]|nr:Cu(I)-responsive transcriptional regulator [Paracoccaceae bacterium]
MNVGQAADRAGLTVKTVRYYADIGLVEPMGRSQAGYRLYSDTEVSKLAFIRRARAFGFSVKECRELLDLYQDKSRSSRDVKAIAIKRLTQIDEKLAELQKLRDELSRLADECHGDHRPDCPILESFSS